MLIAFSSIFLVTIAGIVFWGGMDSDNIVFGLRSSWHDVFYMLLLFVGYIFNPQKTYHYKSVLYFVAGFFLVAGVMQIFDQRKVGDEGGFDLLLDHILNASYIAMFMIFLLYIPIKHKEKIKKGTLLFGGALALFLAFNALMLFDGFRAMANNYALVYDLGAYGLLYLIVLCGQEWIGECVHRSANYLHRLLCRWRVRLH